MAWRKKTIGHDLASVPRKISNGSGSTRPKRSAEERAERNPAGVALKARAAKVGHPDDRHGQQKMQAPWYENEQGQVIAIIHAHDAIAIAPLWAAWAGLTGSDYTYCRKILGASRHPQGAAIAVVPDRLEARPDDKPDDRSEEDKIRDAKNAKAAWELRLRRLPYWSRIAIDAQMIGSGPQLIKDRIATPPGRKFVEALAMLAEQMERER